MTGCTAEFSQVLGLLRLCAFIPSISRIFTADAGIMLWQALSRRFFTVSIFGRRIVVKLSGPGGDRAQSFNEQSLDKLFEGFSWRFDLLIRDFGWPGESPCAP